MNRVVEHGDGEEEGDGQNLSQTKPSPVEPDHEKKLYLRMSKQLLTTAPARAGSHHPLRRAKRVHHPICNIYPLITFHFHGNLYLKIESIFTQSNAHKEA